MKLSMNPLLKPFEVLIGNWTAVGNHPMLPNVLHGRVSFEWMEGGAFFVMRSRMDDPQVPDGIMVIGGDDSNGELTAIYYDERGVSRRMGTSMEGKVWRWWRNAPGFYQSYVMTLSEDGNTLAGKGELCTDGLTWEQDLDLTCTRT